MALMHGKAANIVWDGAGTDVELQHGQTWSLTIEHGVHDITAMQDTWKTYLTGFQDWSATVTCLLDTGGADIGLGGALGMADAEAKLELYTVYATSDYKGLNGSAICTGIALNNDGAGIPTVTYTFQGTDQIAWFSGAFVPTY